MADNSILPKAGAPLVDQTGRPTRAFYSFFNALVSNLQGQINTISKLVKNLALVIAALGGDPDSGEGIPDISGQIDAKADKSITISGLGSIQGGGDLSQDRYISLDGDVDDVPGVSFYGSPDGNVKGWTSFSGNFTPAVDVDDNVTLDLADLADSGTGTALVKITRDSKGRISGTSAATTTDLTEGSNLYFTDERAQDATGAALDGAGDVPLTYDDAGNKISAALSAGVLASLALADSATQPGDLATVATTGAYADLSGLPTLGTAAATDSTDYAMSAQGTKADSAVQSVVAGTNVTVDNTDPQNPIISATGGGGSGDVVGPASAVDGDLALFDGITGKLIKSGGALATSVRSVALTGLSLATSAVISATDTVLQAFGKLQAQITDNLLPAGYIDGLKMVWVSGTALTVTSGAAYIPGSSKVLRATADIAKTGLSLSASTWYHVYLYDNSGTPDVEIVTTAPAAAYNGMARSKTGDTSRRYVGSIRADSSGNILQFRHGAAEIAYMVDVADRIALSAGTATADTTVSVGFFCPITATEATLFVQNTWSANAYLSNTELGSVTTHRISYLLANSVYPIRLPLSPNQTFTYVLNPGSGSGLYVYVAAYFYER